MPVETVPAPVWTPMAGARSQPLASTACGRRGPPRASEAPQARDVWRSAAPPATRMRALRVHVAATKAALCGGQRTTADQESR